MKAHVTLALGKDGKISCLYAGADAAAGIKALQEADMEKFREVTFSRNVRAFKTRRGAGAAIEHRSPADNRPELPEEISEEDLETEADLAAKAACADPAKEEPAKEEPAKEEPAKEEPAKEEPAKEAKAAKQGKAGKAGK